MKIQFSDKSEALSLSADDLFIIETAEGPFKSVKFSTLQDLFGGSGAGSGDVQAANNLSDLDDLAEARENLSVYSQAESNDRFFVKDGSETRIPLKGDDDVVYYIRIKVVGGVPSIEPDTV